MRRPGRSNLFHAIVVAGAGLVGACWRALPNAADGSLDRTADAVTDHGTNADRTDAPMDSVSTDAMLHIDAAPLEATAGDAICMCAGDGGSLSCQICPCDCFKVTDGGACFPCYV